MAADLVIILLAAISQTRLAQSVGEEQFSALQLRPLLADQKLLSPEHRVPAQVTQLATWYIIVEKSRSVEPGRRATQLVIPLTDSTGCSSPLGTYR